MRCFGEHDANAYILPSDISEMFDAHDCIEFAADERDHISIAR